MAWSLRGADPESDSHLHYWKYHPDPFHFAVHQEDFPVDEKLPFCKADPVSLRDRAMKKSDSIKKNMNSGGLCSS